MTLESYIKSLRGKTLDQANREIEKICGIANFFYSEDYAIPTQIEQHSKVEYGDWQTNLDLAKRVCLLLKNQGLTPQVIIEPTCGTGAFILASLVVFGDTISDIHGIEIYKPYINTLKFRLLEYALSYPSSIKCRIHLWHKSIFDFDFRALAISKDKNVLVLGNPPWVTSSKLGEINGDNIPKKFNFKNVRGVDAITGKGNFDIAEFITYKLISAFHTQNAHLAFLIKSSVVKNVVFEQKQGKFNIERMAQYNFDAKKEFDVSVAASLFVAKLGSGCAKQCYVTDLNSNRSSFYYGWVGQYFVAHVDDYIHYSNIDGRSQLIWWSGIKHDCAKVMELDKVNGKFYNKLKEEVDIEPDLIYPLLKSSDIKGQEVTSFRKYVIVTQTNTSDDTTKILSQQPKTYRYLEAHAPLFNKRGSVIYKNRPKYCIFGIGAYSFKPYKIIIAGLYKNTTFSLVKPFDGKPVMLDDTCYLLGFDNHEAAICTLKVLNSQSVQGFMKSIAFFDAKRSINKDLLMRINIEKAAKRALETNEITVTEFNVVMQSIAPTSSLQLQLFA